MAEKVKKTKAPAKPKATVAAAKTTMVKAKKQTVAEKVTATTPTHAEIARLAQQYWAERGWQDGQAEQDWLRAERELLKMAS
jgi:maleate cis-trans isomerase